MRTTPEQARAAAKLGALGSAVVLGTFVVTNHVEEANKAAEEIEATLKRMAVLMEELAGAFPSRPAAVEQVEEAIAQMSAVTEQNARFLREAAVTAKSMKERAQNIARLLAHDARGTKVSSDRRRGK
ncbi:MAG: hypothetical protein ACXWUK_07835 [Burkholderiales bacterium]